MPMEFRRKIPEEATTIPQGERAIRVFPCPVQNKSGYANGFLINRPIH
jgi:hypothetical protein